MKHIKLIVVTGIIAGALICTISSVLIKDNSGNLSPNSSFLAFHPINYSSGVTSSGPCEGIYITKFPAGWPVSYKYVQFLCPPTNATLTSIYPIPVIIDLLSFLIFFTLMYQSVRIAKHHWRKK